MRFAASYALLAPIAAGMALTVHAADVSRAMPNETIPTVSTAELARSGAFYVGGHYLGEPGKEVMHGSMYVEVMVPKKIRHANPIMFLHGAGQTGTDWLLTPDGRAGWAWFFLRRGYVVYLLDHPGRGRSAYVPNVDGALSIRPAPQLSQMWTASAQLGNWPQAKLHTQWPGEGPENGKMGDAVFDSFARTQVQFPTAGLDAAVVDAGIALLDRIGVAVILLAHSQGSTFALPMADARPRQVAAIVAVEPAGPPMQNVDFGRQAYNGRPNLPWGLTNLPMQYEPAVRSPDELQTALEEQPPAPGRVACYLQSGTARKLENLAHVPVLLISGEAGYHRIFDACSAKWLNQAGVHTDYVELETVGLRGNGHQMMLEKNSDRIAAYCADWLEDTL